MNICDCWGEVAAFASFFIISRSKSGLKDDGKWKPLSVEGDESDVIESGEKAVVDDFGI